MSRVEPAQLALVWVAAERAGFRIRLQMPRLTPELRRLAVIAGPAMLAGGVVQINLIVGRQVASFTDGAIVWLSLADTLKKLGETEAAADAERKARDLVKGDSNDE